MLKTNKQKITISIFLIIIIIILNGLSIAYEKTDLATVILNQVIVSINGENMISDSILYNNRTYVELKEICDSFEKELIWNQNTFTALVQNNKRLSKNYNILPTNNASFLGTSPHLSGDNWYKSESKYTMVYFFNDAVEMEWVMEEIDEMFDYLLNFRDLTWDGRKLPIYFYSSDYKLQNNIGYYNSGYRKDKKIITMAAKFQTELIKKPNINNGNNNLLIKEDPRIVLVHEMSHYLNSPSNISIYDMWIDESLASYLSYNYKYKTVNEIKYPSFSNRKFLEFTYLNLDEYSTKKWIDYLNNVELINSSVEEIKIVSNFKEIAKLHYGLSDSISINIRFVEPLIIEYLIQSYGKERFLKLYNNINNYKGQFNLETEILIVYDKELKELEKEFRFFIGLEELPID